MDWRGYLGMGLLAAMTAMAASLGRAQGSDPRWVAQPTAADAGAVLGAAGRDKGMLRLMARCAVRDDGGLEGCRLIEEMPANLGLGEGLLALSPKFRRRPPVAGDPRSIVIGLYTYQASELAEWLRRPTPGMMTEVFPVGAYRKGIDGFANLNCLVSAEGVLSRCVVIEERPEGEGFGGAALAMVPQFRMKPAQRGDSAVESQVFLPLNFQLEGPTRPIRQETLRTIPASLTWVEAPDFAAYAAAYPAGQLRGRVTLSCPMTDQGRLASCEVVKAAPKDKSLEGAAQALASQFRLELATPAEQAAVKSLRVLLPVVFDPVWAAPARAQVERPLWARGPTPAENRAAFSALPPGAAHAELACRAEGGGRLGGCSVVSESASGAGAAALALVPAYRVATWSNAGLPVIGGEVRLTVRREP